MKDFRYTTDPEEAEIESILKARKRKIAKQQVIFSLIFAGILAVIALYFGRKIVYVEFDGYLDTDFNDIRAVDDFFVLDVYKTSGDIIMPGDTMFSYIYLSNFSNQEDISEEADIIQRNRSMWMQYRLAREDITLVRTRIRELKRQLSVEDHNISFGLNGNEHKLRLEKELAEAEEELKVAQRKLQVLLGAAQETGEVLKDVEINGMMVRFEHLRNRELIRKTGLVRYYVSTDTMVITKNFLPDLSLALKGESIIQTQAFDLHSNDLSVVGYIPVDEMEHVNRNTRVDVRITDDISFSAHVRILGVRTEEIPEALRNKLSRDTRAVVVEFSPDPDQTIPFWTLVKYIPVTIRVNRWEKQVKTKSDYIPFNTSGGVVIDSLKLEKRPLWNENNTR